MHIDVRARKDAELIHNYFVCIISPDFCLHWVRSKLLPCSSSRAVYSKSKWNGIIFPSSAFRGKSSKTGVFVNPMAVFCIDSSLIRPEFILLKPGFCLFQVQGFYKLWTIAETNTGSSIHAVRRLTLQTLNVWLTVVSHTFNHEHRELQPWVLTVGL